MTNDLSVLARIEQLRADSDARVSAFCENFPSHRLLSFAADLEAGCDLQKWMSHGSPDEVLRALAYATILREYWKRAELDALEDNGA